MLSNLLSDSFKKTDKYLLERDTRDKTSLCGSGVFVVHNVPGCFSENHPQWPIKKRLVLKNLLLNLGVILTHPLFTVVTLCEHLAISRATLYRLINKGEIEPIRIGSLTRFTENEVKRFLTRQQNHGRAKEVGF